MWILLLRSRGMCSRSSCHSLRLNTHSTGWAACWEVGRRRIPDIRPFDHTLDSGMQRKSVTWWCRQKDELLHAFNMAITCCTTPAIFVIHSHLKEFSKMPPGAQGKASEKHSELVWKDWGQAKLTVNPSFFRRPRRPTLSQVQCLLKTIEGCLAPKIISEQSQEEPNTPASSWPPSS